MSSRSMSRVAAVAALATALTATSCKSSDAPAPSGSAEAAPPSGPATKVGEKALELTPLGKDDPNDPGHPMYKIANKGTKAVTSYAVQVVVTDAGGDKIGEAFSSV